MRIAQRVSADESARNVFVRAERRVVVQGKKDGATLFYALTGKARAAGCAFAEAAEDFSRHLKDLLFFDTNKRSKGYEYVELWLNGDVRNSETFAQAVSYTHLDVYKRQAQQDRKCAVLKALHVQRRTSAAE